MRIKASVSDCGVNFVEMAPDLADNLARMGQEADVPGAFDDFEPGARNRLGKQLLPGRRHDRVLASLGARRPGHGCLSLRAGDGLVVVVDGEVGAGVAVAGAGLGRGVCQQRRVWASARYLDEGAWADR